ncbi:alpha-hydroxy acid oxidase [Mesorhizobium sp. KR2-14]|uniref:alpha-hydroxy acid oxidase n=1 Tax=Mesorhizobium sp. KR2-14 TaxID=3156610 RepID=UPI0032B57E92
MSTSSDNAAPPASLPWHRRGVGRARNIKSLRALAERRLPRAIFDFVDGGAEDEVTLRENSSSYGKYRLLPRVLVDVSSTDLKTNILGRESALPFAIGPTGGAGFVWPRGDLALAKTAEAANIPYALSTTSAVSIEHMRERVSSRLWFQSYIFRQRDFTDKLIDRAYAADYEALVITVDLPVGGNRERDYRNDFAVPFKFTPRNVLDFALHPEWVYTTLRHGLPSFGNLTNFSPSKDVNAAASSVGRNYDSSFNWDDLARIRDRWSRKLIVKGVVHPLDAERLVGMGVDAMVVSNHGGRQLDSGPATIDALPQIVATVNKRAEVFVDGGVRRGSDVFKALALGADAVLLGRASLFGLAGAGPAGVERAVSILREELVRTMKLCGVTNIAEIDRQFLVSTSPFCLNANE